MLCIKVCCYTKTTGVLQTDGSSAGFLYNNDEDLNTITKGGYRKVLYLLKHFIIGINNCFNQICMLLEYKLG